MEKFNKLLKKLQPVKEPSDLVRDPYSHDDMNDEVAEYSEKLTPEDIEKIHFAESTGGQNLKNLKPGSTASGNYHFIDNTRKEAQIQAKKQGFDDEIPNPLRKDAILMKALVKRHEKSLKDAKSGPYDANLENLYLLHKNGITGGLEALKDPENPKSIEKFNEVKMLLAKKPKGKEKEIKPAKNLLELIGE